MKGKKLVIAVILALIVCLVLIPTCAFATGDGTEEAKKQDENVTPTATEESKEITVSEKKDDSDTAGSADSKAGAEDEKKEGEGEADQTGKPAIEVSYIETSETGDVTTGENDEPKTKTVDTIQKALDDNGNDNVKITFDTNVTESITIDENQTVTIDLKGHTLTGNTDGTPTILNKGKLTIIDTSTEQTGKVDNVAHFGRALVNLGTVTIKGGTFTRSEQKDDGSNWDYTIVNGGTMLIEGGTIKETQGVSSAITNTADENILGQAVEKSPTLTITGGTFIGGKHTVDNDPNGTVEITGGTFINDTAKGKDVIRNKSSETNVGTTTIYGGTFTAGEGKYVVTNDGDDSNGKLLIKGGTFNGTIKNTKNTNAPVVTSGVFSDSDVTEFVAKETAAVLSANGKTAIASSKDDESIAAIIDEAMKSGEPLVIEKLIADTSVSAPEGLTIVNDSEKTITVNGVAVVSGASYTVPVKPAATPLNARYFVISGNNQQWTAGDLEIKLNSKDVVKVLIDGVEVEFTVAEDGTVTIASAVIEKLESGLHEIEFVYADGSCKTVFTVK